MSEFSNYQPPAMGGGGGSSGFGSQPNQFAGGFFPSSQDGGNLSAGRSGGRSDHSKQQSIIPVTCRQISDLPDRTGGNAMIFTEGKFPQTITQVSLVGQISNISVEPSSVNFQLDDGTQVGTGGVRCRKYLSVDGQEDELTKQLQEGVYVSIVGTLPFPDDPEVVFAHHIRPLEDFNELTFHLLDALHWYLRSMRGPVMDQQQQQQQQQHGAGSYAQMDIVETGGDGQNTMKPFLRDVLKVFVQHSGSNDDTGVHINVIMQNLPGKSEQQIREAINELINLGEVYSTIDDDHHSYARA